MNTVKAYASFNKSSDIQQSTIQRREPLAGDVQIEILYCGVCHSDLHQARNEWHDTIYPCVPGHEIVGRVTKVGNEVRKFKVGDLAAVGVMVDSCKVCPSCLAGEEQYCENGFTGTFNWKDKHTGGHTFGGYSESIVVDEAFVLHVPQNMDLAAVAPLLCAGITTYSPLRHWGVGKGMKVGIVGLGGLGHMAVKFANAFGADVTLFTTSTNKIEDAKRVGAHEVILSTNENEMKKHVDSFDFILDTVSGEHDLSPYLHLLKRDATLTLVGAPEKPMPIAAFDILFKRKRLAGSIVGGVKETQEMLDFSAKHGINADIELIPIQQINQAYERILKSDLTHST